MPSILPPIGFCIYLFLTISHFFGDRVFSADESGIQVNQILGILIFYLLSIINKINGLKFDLHYSLLFLISPFFISSILSLEPISIVWTLIYASNCILIYDLIKNNFKSTIQSFRIFSFILVLLLFLQLFIYGVDFISGRYVGNFRPVDFASVSLIACFLGIFSSRKNYELIFYIFSFFILTISVISRASIFTGILFLLIYFFLYMYYKNKFEMIYRLIIAFIMIFIPFYIIFFEQINPSIELLFTFLDLTDSERGFGSGFTGRLDKYLLSFEVFKQRPLFGMGYGLYDKSHSGILQLLIELGLYGFFVYIIFLLNIFNGCHVYLKQVFSKKVIASISFIIAFQFLAIFERQLINFGHIAGLIILFNLLFAIIVVDKYNLKIDE